MVDKTILKAQNRGLLLDDPDPGSLLDRLERRPSCTNPNGSARSSHDRHRSADHPIRTDHHLDTVRGIATLGILVMNAVSFGLPQPAYFNLDYAGSDTALDWIVGVLGEVFVDQKTMAMFSMLFGAGIVVFADRAAAKGRRANWLSLWRNTLLLGIGLVHAVFWFGDVLMLYAICSPVLLLLAYSFGPDPLHHRRRLSRTLRLDDGRNPSRDRGR